jgi:histone H2A
MPAKKGAAKKANVSNSNKAGLKFPVGRISRMLKKGLYSRRVGLSAGVYLASVLESVIEDIVEVAASQADVLRKKSLTPRHIQLGIRSDPELS